MAFYRRNLPHWQPIGAEYFITFRLAGSLPKKVIEELKRERAKFENKVRGQSRTLARRAKLQEIIQRKIFQKYEEMLDKGSTGPTWLKTPEIAETVKESIHYRDKKDYDLYAYCIMSNHVHLVFRHLSDIKSLQQPEDYFPVTDIMESLKKYTSRRCNQFLNRTGNSFWQAESYDHVIRDSDELERVIYYTLQNPVKAGLVDEWRSWPHTYCKPEFAEQF